MPVDKLQKTISIGEAACLIREFRKLGYLKTEADSERAWSVVENLYPATKSFFWSAIFNKKFSILENELKRFKIII
jgi:hypothetical protein